MDASQPHTSPKSKNSRVSRHQQEKELPESGALCPYRQDLNAEVMTAHNMLAARIVVWAVFLIVTLSLTAGLVCYCCSQLAVLWRFRTGVWHALWSFFVLPCLCMKSGVWDWECISSYASKGHGPQNIDSNRLSTVLCNNQFDFWCVCEAVWTEAISSSYQRQEREGVNGPGYKLRFISPLQRQRILQTKTFF